MSVPFAFLKALKERAPLAVLVRVDHPDGVVRLWSGVGLLDYDGHEWTGAGILGSVQASRKSVELRIDEVTLSLSGIDPQALGEISDEIRNREADVWLAALTPRLRVRAVMLIDNISLDHMTDSLSEDGTATLQVVGEAGFWQLQRVTDEVWSDANQQLKFPGDTGLGFIATMRNKQTNWTRT
jgi:hypothetical protein